MTTETKSTTCREISTRKIEGSRALIPYAGTLVLLACAEISATSSRSHVGAA